jgi:hypothetical protein
MPPPLATIIPLCTTSSHPIMGFNVSWFAIVKTKLAKKSWLNSYDEICNFFSKNLLESHPNFFYVILVHLGFIDNWFFCGL